MDGSVTNKQEELSKIWANASGNGKDDKRSLKLNVEYVYPKKLSTPVKTKQQSHGVMDVQSEENMATASSTSTSNNAHSNSNNHHTSSSSSSSSSNNNIPFIHTNNNTTNSNNNNDWKDIQELKVKYDAIVEYTVHLTAERDMIVTQLETLKKEYNAEMLKKKSLDGGNSSSNGSSSNTRQQKGLLEEGDKKHGASGTVQSVSVLISVLIYIYLCLSYYFIA